MPIMRAQGSFSVGRDCTIVVQHPLASGGRVDLPNVTEFKAAEKIVEVKTDRLDGVQLSAKLPKGWTGSFMVDRANAALEDLIALMEANWYASGALLPATIFQFINEVDGSQTTYQYTSVALHLADAGDWRGDQNVKQSVEFEAWRRLRS